MRAWWKREKQDKRLRWFLFHNYDIEVGRAALRDFDEAEVLGIEHETQFGISIISVQPARFDQANFLLAGKNQHSLFPLQEGVDHWLAHDQRRRTKIERLKLQKENVQTGGALSLVEGML